jgi:hypothetical protein
VLVITGWFLLSLLIAPRHGYLARLLHPAVVKKDEVRIMN